MVRRLGADLQGGWREAVTLDRLDRKIVAALQISPRASWRRVAGAVGSTESTVARRAERLMAAGVVRATVISEAVTPEVYVLMQFDCELKHAEAVGVALAERDDSRFVALVTGPFDVVAEMVAPSAAELARIILRELPAVAGIKHTTTETEVRNFKTSYDWSYDLLGADGAQLQSWPAASDRSAGAVSFDTVDDCLLRSLRRDGRARFAELAADCGITESMARRRVEHLFTYGGVRPAALVDPHLLGYDVELLLWLHVDLGRLEEVATALAVRREVRYISATSGYSDLVCEVIMRNQDDLYEFMTHVLGRLPGIRQVDIASELVTLKRAFVRSL